MKPRYYAGIGSRVTPPRVLDLMHDKASELQAQGWTLRSGGATGADRAFEAGAGGCAEIYTAHDVWIDSPWLAHAMLFHPAWHECGDYVRRLHARNSAIICGPDLLTPVEFVICWTKGGEVAGGTGQGLRIAAAYGIPIYNYGAEA